MKDYGAGLTAFDLVFPDLVMGENTVLCPFHSEKSPSCQINTQQKIFHCFGCGAKGTENDFISMYYGVDKNQASSFKEVLFKSDCLEDYEKFATSGKPYLSNSTYKDLISMGASADVMEDLKVGCEVWADVDADTGAVEIKPNTSSSRLVFPIIVKDRVVDLRTYTTDKTVKPKSSSKA